MSSRFKDEPVKKRDSSHDDEMIKYEYKKRMRVLSTNQDGSVDKYVEECYWEEEKSSWSDFINSYDLGSVQEQVMSHIEKGTPLVTAHTLPPADYTKLEKGAEIKREMSEKGITIDQLLDAITSAMAEKAKAQEVVEEGAQ